MSSLASLALLIAMGAIGVAALRRVGLELDPLEQVAYGLPLGVVVASLALLPLGIAFGLSAALVVALGVLCGVGAVVLWPERPSWTVVRSVLEPRPLGLTAAEPAPMRSLDPVVRVLRTRLSWAPTLVIGAFVVRWAVFWHGAMASDAAGLWAGHPNLWADWALHLGDVTSFAYGDNFPPTHPRLVGSASYAYHYLTSLTAAALVVLGMDPAHALTLHSFLFSVLVALGLYAFTRRLTRDRGVAALTVALFLLGGGLGWVYVLGKLNGSGGVVATVLWRAWDAVPPAGANFSWPNVYYALIAPQRGYVYGLPLGLLVLTLLLGGVQTGGRRRFLAAGVAAGLLPFAHLGSLLALALVAPFVAALFPGPAWRPFPARRWLVLPAQGWFLFVGAWIAHAVPQLYLQQGGRPAAASGLRWQAGWVAGGDPWPWYWLKNLGLFLPLLVVALATRGLVAPVARRFLWAFMPVFVIANLVVFQPWDWDNTKVLVYWFLAAGVLVASLIVKVWRAYRTPAVRFLIAGVVASLVLSGLLVELHQLLGKDRYLMLTAEELALAEAVRARTARDAVFVVGFQHNHPVPMLTGRPVMMSFPGWIWSYGIDAGQREQDLRAIYALAPNAPELLRQYGVDYVVIGWNERAQFGADAEAFRTRYPRVIDTGGYQVFAVSDAAIARAQSQ